MERALSLAFEEDEEDECILRRARRPRWICEREEQFDTLDDQDFVTRFCLTKSTVLSVLESIEDKLEFPSNMNHSLSPINRLLCALRFYTTGCYQMTAADLGGFSSSTVHRIMHRVSAAIASLRPRHIYFPELPDNIRQTQIEFYKMARFPYVIGAIDCTYV